jgi:polyisoprenyl-phosphate glycosyltransferase
MPAPSVSVVIPVYGNADSLSELCQRLVGALSPGHSEFEIILIDDGSPDESWTIIRRLAAADRRIKGIRLSRNFGQHPAIAAGFDRAAGDVIVLMDADLEDRPENLPEIIGKLSSEVDIVYTIKSGYRGEPRFTSALFHSVFSRITKASVPANIGTLRAFNRKVLKAIQSHREYNVLFGPLMFFIGFPSTFVEVKRDKRRHGRSSYTFVKRLRLAVRSLFSYTDLPNRFFLTFGVGVVVVAGLYGTVVMFEYFFLGIKLPPGLTLVVLLNVLLIGIMMVSLGVIGSYVFRVYQEVLGRPRYLVVQQLNLTAADRDPGGGTTLIQAISR